MRNHLIAATAMMLMSAPALAQQTYQDAQAQCPSGVPIKGDLVVLSMYGGHGAPLSYSFDGDEHGAHAVSVTGSGSGKITLVLTAYETTVWDLSAIRDRVAGVMAYGFYPQAVSGLPKTTPITFRSTAGNNQPEDACFIPYVDEGMYKIQQQADHIKEVLGAQPRRWYGGYSPNAFNVDGGPATAPTAPSPSTIRAGVRMNTEGLLPGNDGIEQLIRAGALRRIDRRDVDEWAGKNARLTMTEGPYMRMGLRPGKGPDPIEAIGSDHSGYLVLRSIRQIPAGLNGADEVVFVVPQGINVPQDPGHGTFYRLDGYPGRIPSATGRVVPIDTRAQEIQRLGAQGSPASMSVEWDAQGRVVKDGTQKPDSTQSRQTFPMQSVIKTLPPAPPTILESGNSSKNDATENGHRGYLEALAAVLVIGGAGAFAFRHRERLRQRINGLSADQTKSTRTQNGRDANPHVAKTLPTMNEETTHSDALTMLEAQFKQVMDITDDDTTGLSLMRMRRTVVRAVRIGEYNDDIAIEMESIVEQHLPEHISIYLSARRRVEDGRYGEVDRTLVAAFDRMSNRISELMESQSQRDVDRMQENGEFIRIRHGLNTDEPLA